MGKGKNPTRISADFQELWSVKNARERIREFADAGRFHVCMPQPYSHHGTITYVPADGLRRLTKGPQERLPQTTAISKTRFLRHLIQRVLGLFHHHPRGFNPEIFNRLGGRLPGLGAKGAAELPGTQISRLGQLFHG
jgi:hypothetical protein